MERVFIQLSNFAARRGIQVTLAVLNKDGPLVTEVDPTVAVYDLEIANARRGLMKLAKLIYEYNPRVLLSGLTHLNLLCVISSWLSFRDVSVVLSERNIVSFSLKKSHQFLFRALMRFTYPKVETIITVSERARQDLNHFLQRELTNVITIHNPIDTQYLLDMSEGIYDESSCRNIEQYDVLAVGRLVPQKDFRNLINAIQIVNEKKRTTLGIIGDGHLRSDLEKQIQDLGLNDVVTLCGTVRNPYRHMRNCKLFVSSSRFEGFPNSLLQAMVLSPIVVATDCVSGPREILKNGDFGILVEVGDVDGLADAIVQCLGRPLPRDRQKLQRHLSSFESNVIMNKYIEALGLH